MGVANLITNINQTQINGFGMILGKISSITNINQVVTSAEQSQEFPQKQGGRENYDQ